MTTTEKQILYAKAEGTYNTDPTIAATDAYRVIDPTYKLDPHLYRPAIGGIRQCTPNPAQIGMRWPDMTFKQEIRGNGVTPIGSAYFAQMHPFIRACGFGAPAWDAGAGTNTYTWAAVSGSVWLEMNTGGLFQPMGGARGTFSVELVPGERAIMDYAFSGNYQPIAPVPMTAPTYDDAAPPMVVQGIQLAPYGMTPTPGEVKNRVTKATLNLRGEVYRLPDVNGTEGIGEVFTLGMGTPADRGPQLVLEVTADDTPPDAWWVQFLARNLGAACSITLGDTSTGLKQMCEFVFPGGLYVDAIEDIVIGSLRGHKLTFAIPGTVAGSDEDAISIVWTQG